MTELSTSRHPLGAVTAGFLRVRRGLGDTTISTTSRGTDLFEARWQRCPPTVDVRAGTVTLRFPLVCPWRTVRAHELALHGAIPWSIDIGGGAKNVAADLSGSDLRALDVNGGVSGMTVDLGRPTAMVPIRFGAVHSVTLRRPAGVPVRVGVSGGVSRLTVDERTMGAVGGPVNWSSPDFDDAIDRYDVLITGAARDLTVKELP
jgi:hypothetical protein